MTIMSLGKVAVIRIPPVATFSYRDTVTCVRGHYVEDIVNISHGTILDSNLACCLIIYIRLRKNVYV